MTKKIVYIPNGGPMNIEMLSKEFDLIIGEKPNLNLTKVNFILTWSTVPDHVIEVPEVIENLAKTIYVAYEPPLTNHRHWCFANFDRFHTVFAYDPKGENEFPISTNPVVFPANPCIENDIIRKDTTIKTRGIYYSGGKCPEYRNEPDRFGGIVLKCVRDDLCDYLLKNYHDVTVIGPGWEKNTKNASNFRLQKIKDLEECNADFHLVIENCMYPGLVSERIHDGFGSDRVVLYLGDPYIEEYVPPNAFIDLRPLFNPKNHKFDYEGFIKLISNISQKDYDQILNNARLWRKTLIGLFEKERDQLTQKIINRINQNG